MLDNLRAMCEGFTKSAGSIPQCFRGRALDTLIGGYRYLGDEKYRAEAVKQYANWPDRRYNHNKDMGANIFGGCLVPCIENGGVAPAPDMFDKIFRR